MTIQDIVLFIAGHNPLPPKFDPENLDAYFSSYSIEDAFGVVAATNAVELSSPEDLEEFQKKLEENYKTAGTRLSREDYFEKAVLDCIREDGVSMHFDEELIRKALEKGFYPMSFSFDGMNLLSVRYHYIKCIITFDKLRIPHNVKKLIQKKFSDYTITFNKAYDDVVKEILSAYKETWLTPELLEVFKNIHENPDDCVSVDTVEIWHEGKLVAGELGFVTHNAYASLTGFHKEDDIGNVQLALLGLFLKENGFAYWDLGMSIPYKYRFGALDYSREGQEELWKKLSGDRISFPDTETKLSSFLDFDFNSEVTKPDFSRIVPFGEPGTEYVRLGRQICGITEDLNVQLLFSAYMQGVFPWFDESRGEPVVWYSTDPRFCILPEHYHEPESCRKALKKTPYTYTMDRCFKRVMTECASMKREGQDGTWIGPKMIDVYTKLHKAGLAHSVEVWKNGKLCGGFYGVLIGSVFFGESMFTKERDSSKTAFMLFARTFWECGGLLVDSQSYTDNIARYGAENISRDAFLRLEKTALHKPLEKDLKCEFMKKALEIRQKNLNCRK